MHSMNTFNNGGYGHPTGFSQTPVDPVPTGPQSAVFPVPPPPMTQNTGNALMPPMAEFMSYNAPVMVPNAQHMTPAVYPYGGNYSNPQQQGYCAPSTSTAPQNQWMMSHPLDAVAQQMAGQNYGYYGNQTAQYPQLPVGLNWSSYGYSAPHKPAAGLAAPSHPPVKMTLIDGENSWGIMDANCHEIMVSSKGKEIFPHLRFSVQGLNPKSMYRIGLKLVRVSRSEWTYTKDGVWKESNKKSLHGSLETNEVFCSKAMNGWQWMRQGVNFSDAHVRSEKSEAWMAIQKGVVGLRKTSQSLVVELRRKYRPVVTVYEVAVDGEKKVQEFTFPKTEFITVSEIKNEDMKHLKSVLNRNTRSEFKEVARKALAKSTTVKLCPPGLLVVDSEQLFSPGPSGSPDTGFGSGGDDTLNSQSSGFSQVGSSGGQEFQAPGTRSLGAEFPNFDNDLVGGLDDLELWGEFNTDQIGLVSPLPTEYDPSLDQYL
ncbi:hypothetical protein CAEBREN_24797 [Caenorhabditis brenneri]|uniref:T-box domain-containing protein n=1 Tax=Caenorhabditis brenneri TaxID=135651 RepID=G0MM20_CAEBE|nr:hypothetical protein CAEBREN_24797 [Caenorhabditis brenneri]